MEYINIRGNNLVHIEDFRRFYNRKIGLSNN